jgi:hypothetical protein
MVTWFIGVGGVGGLLVVVESKTTEKKNFLKIRNNIS